MLSRAGGDENMQDSDDEEDAKSQRNALERVDSQQKELEKVMSNYLQNF